MISDRATPGVLLLLSMLLGCASSQPRGPVVGEWESPAQESLEARNLDEYLALQPGVTVNGSGPRAQIHVSGATYPNPPLFVIDGAVIGNDFAAVWSQAPMWGIESVRVIRATDTRASRYGVRGGNGIIEITMKRG